MTSGNKRYMLNMIYVVIFLEIAIFTEGLYFMPYHFSSPKKLVDTEEVDQSVVENLRQTILRQQIWTRPIAVERTQFLVMDGHHRLEVARQLNLAVIPVVLLDYERVSVTSWRPEECITPDDIFAMARSGKKFPIKTTRHVFADDYPVCDVPLAVLAGIVATMDSAMQGGRAVLS
ncbi:hypothetical protein RvVAR0630_pl01100 (plasmid) [Agrobacterium vitis]|uniref:ParB N-terminal domain-containing protein n=1 Tax=Agrobacterium vitis TaxID=373 RepID=UPI0015DD170A|nr:ParB N-terminal domain-containing protein [Agrobacterium vitis]BCH61968.1 hypothetical protein RvVAR0630_pl01100 [Agrobacterium vitis]